MVTITLCADDYALHPAIDQAVLILAQRGILHATSCMSTSPHWAKAAPALRSLQGVIDIGLHLNLTEGFGQSAITLPTMIARSYMGLLNRQTLILTLRKQFDAFTDALGFLPNMLDGHQHIHQLPLVRDVLLETIENYYGAQPSVWIRNTLPVRGAAPGGKAALLRWLGGKRFAQQIHARGLSTNHGFAGVYGFDAADEIAYGNYMRSWLEVAQNGMLMMCHPAAEPIATDVIGMQRYVEFSYLKSLALTQLCARLGIVFGRMPTTI